MNTPANLSALESTPELATAIELIQNKGRGKRGFYTTLGHIVTKILDMNITVHLPDGSTYRPFTTPGEVNTFFRIGPEDYTMSPNIHIMNHLVSDIYIKLILPKEKEVLKPRYETMKEFFEANIWEDIDDEDVVEVLLGKISELSHMGIKQVTKDICDDVNEWIIMHCIGMGSTLSEWQGMNEEEKKQYLVQDLQKEKFTDYFADLVVSFDWKDNPHSPYYYMQDVSRKIRSLYRVDSVLEESLGKASDDQFRNTRYV